MDLNTSCKDNATNTSCSDTSVPLHSAVIYALVIGLTSGASISLNAVHFKTIRSFQDLPIPSKVIFKVHAICDICLALIYGLMIPLIASHSWYLRNLYCIISSCFLAMCSTVHIVLYVLHHVNRFLSVLIPYGYTAFMSNRKIWIVTLGTLVVLTVMFFSNIKNMDVSHMPTGICYLEPKASAEFQAGYEFLLFGVLIPSTIFILVYAWLLTVTYRHARKIHAQELAGAPHAHQGQGVFDKIRSIKRALLVTTVTFGWFALTGIPVGIWFSLNSKNSHLHYSFAMLSWWMYLCQTFGNVIGLLLKESYRNSLRKEITTIFCLLRCKATA